MAATQQDFLDPKKNVVMPQDPDGGGAQIDPGGTVVPDVGSGTDPNTGTTDPAVDATQNPDFLPVADPIQGDDPVSPDPDPTTPAESPTTTPSVEPDPASLPPDAGAGGAGSDPMGLGGVVPGVDTDSVGVPGSGTDRADNAQQDIWNIDKNQTVSGQMEKLLDRDSPFFEQARNRMTRRMLAAGGRNSAMAEGFGEQAAMDQAFKMAFEDAKTYGRSAEFNASMANQFSLAEQRFIHNATLSDQNFKQAGVLQTQRIEAQFEAIRMDFKGRDVLLKQQLATSLAQAQIAAGASISAAQIGAAGRLAVVDRQIAAERMMQISNYFTGAMGDMVNDINEAGLGGEAARAAMESGTQWIIDQLPIIEGIWAENTGDAGG